MNTYTYIHVFIYLCICIYKYVHMYICTCICNVCMSVSECVGVCIYLYVYTCAYVYICVSGFVFVATWLMLPFPSLSSVFMRSSIVIILVPCTHTHTHRSHIHSRTLTCLHTHCHSDTRTPAGICGNEAMDRTGGRLNGRVLGSFLSAFASSLESTEPLMSVSNILKTCIPHRKSSCVPVCANVFECVCRSGTYIYKPVFTSTHTQSQQYMYTFSCSARSSASRSTTVGWCRSSLSLRGTTFSGSTGALAVLDPHPIAIVGLLLGWFLFRPRPPYEYVQICKGFRDDTENWRNCGKKQFLLTSKWCSNSGRNWKWTHSTKTK